MVPPVEVPALEARKKVGVVFRGVDGWGRRRAQVSDGSGLKRASWLKEPTWMSRRP